MRLCKHEMLSDAVISTHTKTALLWRIHGSGWHGIHSLTHKHWQSLGKFRKFKSLEMRAKTFSKNISYSLTQADIQTYTI